MLATIEESFSKSGRIYTDAELNTFIKHLEESLPLQIGAGAHTEEENQAAVKQSEAAFQKLIEGAIETYIHKSVEHLLGSDDFWRDVDKPRLGEMLLSKNGPDKNPKLKAELADEILERLSFKPQDILTGFVSIEKNKHNLSLADDSLTTLKTRVDQANGCPYTPSQKTEKQHREFPKGLSEEDITKSPAPKKFM